MMKRPLCLLTVCLALAGCAKDHQAEPDADKAAVDETLAWLAAQQGDVPAPDPKECSPEAFLSRIRKGDTKGGRALCTEKGFRDVERLGFDKIMSITTYPPAIYLFPELSEKDEDHARFVYIRTGLGPKTLCVIEMRKVGNEWHVDDISEPRR